VGRRQQYKRREESSFSDKKTTTTAVLQTTDNMSIKAIVIASLSVASTVSAAGWGGPDMHTTCTDCTNAGMTWQKEANRCTGKCDIPDISCQRTPAECGGSPQPIYPPQPVYPQPEPFDCYVDLRGSGMNYINIWRKKPCTAKFGSFGALYQVSLGFIQLYNQKPFLFLETNGPDHAQVINQTSFLLGPRSVLRPRLRG
jgi:hypothetical protein